MSDQEYEQSGVRFTDKRRVDPETNQVRQPAGSAGAPGLLDALQEESDEATVLEVEVVEGLREIETFRDLPQDAHPAAVLGELVLRGARERFVRHRTCSES